MAATMRAVVLTGHGGLDKLEYHRHWPKPAAGGGEVLIRVGACGLNNTDVNTRSGWYSKGVSGATTGAALAGAQDADAAWCGAPVRLPRIQGADAVGVVESVGSGVSSALLGRRVLIDGCLRDWDSPHNLHQTGYFGSECDGGFAEYTTAPVRQVHPINCNLTDAELATFAISYTTAENMLTRAAVCAGETVLITGASGGVGSALIQLVNRRGARAIAMCGDDKAERVRAIGATTLPRQCADLPAALQAASGQKTVDVVADVVAGECWPALIEAVARGGRYVCSGAIAGPLVRFDLRTFYLRDLTFYGATVAAPGIFADLLGYIERGEIRPLLAATYPLEKLQEAQQAFIDKRHVGNIVVCP